MPFAIDLKFIYEPLTTNEEMLPTTTATNTNQSHCLHILAEPWLKIGCLPCQCLCMQWMTNEKEKKNPNKRQ